MPQLAPLYYEVRAMRMFGTPTPVASDIARHLQSRQYLGFTIVVCNNPLSMLSALRKQWLRLSRNLQKQRASTLNAEEILRFTHTIMHMQHLQFAIQPPAAETDAHIFFVTPEDLQELPPGCLSLYVTAPPKASQLRLWIEGLAKDALVVDYEGSLGLEHLGLEPKSHIEARMRRDWAEMREFMRQNGADITKIVDGVVMQPKAMDDALDCLLGTGNEFLRRAAEFQHMLSLSQPLKHEPATQTKQFEAVMRLAHRVQSLTPGSFSHYLVGTFNERNAGSYFLRDAAPEEDDLFGDDDDSEAVTFYDALDAQLVTEYS